MAATGERIDAQAFAPLAAWARTTHGDAAFQAACAAASIVPAAFSNGDQLPLSQLERWLSALRDGIGGDGPLLSGGMASEPPRSGPPRWLQSFATPGLLYRGSEARRWTTGGAGRLAVGRFGLGAARIRYSSAEPESRVLCLWRQARLAQRSRAWGLAPAVVQETRCLAHGDDACEYVVRWHARPRWTGTLVATAATVAWLSSSGAGVGVSWIVPVLVASVAHAVEIERVRHANGATAAAFGTAFRRARAATPARRVAVEPEPVAVATPPTRLAEEPASVRREGDFWRITYASKTILVRHSRGLSLLVHLLRNPRQDVHVSVLDALSPSGSTMPMAASAPGDVPVGDLGDAGEVLDAQAKATYRRRLVELREELAEAEANNDLGRVEHLRAEAEALTEQLRQATGLGGRSRRVASNADRVRVAVTRRIRAAIAQIEKHHHELGAHLGATVHTGYFCSYGPGDVPWRE